MSRSSQRPEVRSGPPSHKSGRRRIFAFGLAAFYATLILGLAFFLSGFTHELSRTLAHRLESIEPIASQNLSSSNTVRVPSSGAQSESSPAPDPSEPSSPASVSVENPLLNEAINILLLGTDERPDEIGPPRTDTMMVLSLDLKHRTIGMISLPRDLWVPIPGYDISTKINSAYVIGEKRGYPGGGPQLAKDTVSSFLGHPIQYFVRVNFNGFVTFVDQIGGVELSVPQTIHDERYPTPDYGYETFHLAAGTHLLSGETALKYVRTRNGDDDYSRAARQQQVIQSIIDRVMNLDMIPMLVARAPQLMTTMRNSVQTDIPLDRAVSVAGYVRQNSFQDVRRLVLDRSFGEESYSHDGAWILLPDRSRIRPVLSEFFSVQTSEIDENVTVATGSDLVSTIAAGASDTLPSTQPLLDDPTQVRVEILNGSGYPGVAGRLRQMLEGTGWQVVSIGDADRSDYRRTLIVNYNVDDAVLDQVSRDIMLQPALPRLNGLIISNTVDMRIIVGQDFLKDVLDVSR